MLNRVSIIGRLGADPEVRTTAGGNGVVNFRVAVSEQWKDKATGERKERTEWVPCVSWNEGLNRVLESYVRKGQLVYVEGAFQTRQWEKDGEKRYTTEVVLNANGQLRMLGGKSDDAPAERQGTGYTGRSAPAPVSNGKSQMMGDLNDEVPFLPCKE